MSASALRDIRQSIANRIHARTHDLARKLTAQELSTKTHVPEAHAVPVPVAKYVCNDKVIDLTHSPTEPKKVEKKYKPWSPLDYLPPRQLQPNSLLHCFAKTPTTNRRHRVRAKIECTITIDDDTEVEDPPHVYHRAKIQRPESSSEEEYDPLEHDYDP